MFHFGFLKYAHLHLLHGLQSQSACYCKITLQSVEHVQSYCKFLIFNMAAIRDPKFLNYANFYLSHGLQSWPACSCKISSRLVERFWSYYKFSISNMAAVRPLGFLKYANFTFRMVRVRIWLFMQNFVTIGWMVAKLMQVFDFQYGGRPPSWIFKVCKFSPCARFAITIGVFL